MMYSVPAGIVLHSMYHVLCMSHSDVTWFGKTYPAFLSLH